MEKFSTTNFLPALTSFLRHILPDTTITPSHRDRFNTSKERISWQGEFNHGQGQDVDLCKCKWLKFGKGIPLRYCIRRGRPTFTQTRRWIIRYVFGVYTTIPSSVSRSGPVRFFSLFWTRPGPVRSSEFPFWEKTEPDWEKPVYIGPVLDICQL